MWKTIEGYEQYSVSNSGEVRNDTTGKILKQLLDKDGYPMVTLCGKKRRWVGVHRLVTQAFIPNPNNYPIVNHKDENKTNNFVWVNPDGSIDPDKSNLEWCDYAYSTNYGTRNTRTSIKLGKTIYQFLGKKLVGIWHSTKAAGKANGISPSNIASCARGERDTAGGYKWSYVQPINNI